MVETLRFALSGFQTPAWASAPFIRVGWPQSVTGVPRLLCDRLLPAFLFGLLAVSAARKVLALAQQGPADPSSQAQLLYWLALAHRSLGFLFPALLTVLYVIRRSPVGARAGVLPMVIALLGTFGMSLAVSQPVTTVDWRVLALGDLLVAGGLIFTL